jgi:hypothetical protein
MPYYQPLTPLHQHVSCYQSLPNTCPIINRYKVASTYNSIINRCNYTNVSYYQRLQRCINMSYYHTLHRYINTRIINRYTFTSTHVLLSTVKTVTSTFVLL